MFASTSAAPDAAVHYRLLPTPQGITLELWEPKAASPWTASSYQFCLRYDVASEAAALAMLHQYLATNGIEQAIAHPRHEPQAPVPAALMYTTLG